MTFPHLFSPIKVGGHELPNRLYVPAHQEMFAEAGLPSKRQADYYRLRARAGAAMQITGNTAVTGTQRSETGPARLANIDDSIVPGYQLLAEAVHDEGGRLLAQLSHSGLLTRSSNTYVIAASEYRPERTRETGTAVTAEQISEITEAFRQAAGRVSAGNLDGVELLMARGSLLGTFLSPAFNQREDDWGGTLINRLRFPLAVVAAVREALGPEAILGVRLSANDFVEDGITPDVACDVARSLESTGAVDYLSVTGGTPTHRVPFTLGFPATPTSNRLFRELAATIRKAVDLPVACVGRVTDPALAEDIVASGDADLVGVVRAQIADANFFVKAKTGRTRDIRPCVGANVCANFHLAGDGIRCIGNPEVGRERSWGEISPAPQPKRCVVVGAGPAGLEAARVLAIRGHDVVLIDKDHAIGGQLRLWTESTSRQEFRKLLEWWEHALERASVRVELSTNADLAHIHRYQADHLVVATGSTPVPSPLGRCAPGMESLSVHDALRGKGNYRKVAVIDEMGRTDAFLIAERLAERGAIVTLVTNCLHVAEGEGESTLYPILLRLNELGITVKERARVRAGNDGSLQIVDVFGDTPRGTVSADAVVHWCGATPFNDLAAAARAEGIDVTVIGDALQPRRVHHAVSEGAAAARIIGTQPVTPEHLVFGM